MKKFVVTLVTSLALVIGTPVAFASDSSESNKTEFAFTDNQTILFEAELTAWNIEREAIREIFKTAKVKAREALAKARKFATTNKARKVAEVAFATAMKTARQINRSSLKILGAPPSKPEVASPPKPEVASKMDDILAKVNQRRATAGLASVIECPALSQSALAHSQDMYTRAFFAHENPDGDGPTDRIRLTGYLTRSTSWSTGENIAKGYVDVTSVMTGWMNSPGHRANILNSSFTHLGIGVVKTRPDSNFDGFIWTQNFGSGGTC